ncbi:MAG: hypothetical protein AUJ52_05755 [Elusimicrobia bacterium CG1_02_63_36]|nr:MAG: hypothetical protein AUJ52_05755 [Elusimicrobia bacterium CG1_02_63_36]PIP81699.1 MAG: hypothetical protein COR54_18745 [Elusimicrobia bacterium CG22_combo_CG10-13_8_21_14_all_63_91]PJA17685.1 MAG: hypothetical protein COX66_03665 [Elusimicrobia bacterium CG_4_10_14_0_2_um_filter_63_34]PJB24769.1 MAG: hypothetical protein CO113_12035 [Elusimicrobia bacterium CG_4_9_14_3_um_filter_62_55]
MTIDAELLKILACPESKKPLAYFREEGFLFCPDSRLKYPVKDGVPVLIVEEAERLDEASASTLEKRARESGLL